MGAWTGGLMYEQGMGQRSGTDNISFGVRAIETELTALGFTVPSINGRFGKGTKTAAVNFQLTERLLSDGIVGPKTARALFTPRIDDLEAEYGIPYHLLCGIAAHESSFDPGAFGSDHPADKGLVQINLDQPPAPTTLAQAFDPAYALGLCAKTLKTRHDYYAKHCKTGRTDAWSIAVCSWNSPANANLWCQSGEPNAAALHYVDLVRAGCAS